MRILIVDDVPLVGKSMRRILRGLGEVDVVGTGASAIAIHGNVRYDVILVDINLPDATGPLLAVRLQQEWPTRIVLMSGNPELAGWDGDLLLKPFSSAEARAAVAKAMTRPPRGGAFGSPP